MKLAQIAKLMNEKGAKAYWIGPNPDAGQEWHIFGTGECLIGAPVITEEVRAMLAKTGLYEPDMMKAYGQTSKGTTPNVTAIDKAARGVETQYNVEKTPLMLQVQDGKKQVTLRMLQHEKRGLIFVDEKFVEILEPGLIEGTGGDPLVFVLENGMRAVVMPFRVQPDYVTLQDAKHYMKEWTK